MRRPRIEGVRTKIIASLALLAGLVAGCAAVDAKPEARPRPPAPNGGGVEEVSDRAELQACYVNARLRDPALSVHTVALFFARDGKFVFVDVELPEAPALARCLSDAILRSAYLGPVAQGAGTHAGGGLRIDLGPPLATPLPPPSLAEMRARHRRAALRAMQQGVLSQSDPLLRELLNPTPPWPTREMQAELEACHRDALRSYPGLVLHRDVIFLARGDKMLLADVDIPEAPELRRCVLDRVRGWSSPFPGASTNATLSGFFMHLGAPEALPDRPKTLTAELDRRRALIQQALALGLISADDPLLERFESSGHASN